MATTIKKSQKAQNGKGNQRQKIVTPEQRLGQRIRYNIRHPISAFWGWLGSVRTAIFLITAIAFVCLLGIYFIQAPDEVLGDPVAYAGWVQQNALPRYGSLTPTYHWLQFFTIFSSWYFKLLLVLLSLNIIVGTLNRVPAIWQNFAHPLIRRNDKFYQNALERSEFSHERTVEWTRDALRKRGYRVRSLVETGETPIGNVGASLAGAQPAPTGNIGAPIAGAQPAPTANVETSRKDTHGVTYLYANKNTWATFSTFVFHAALVILLLAGALSQWHGFDPNSPARRYLPAPIVSLSDSLAGFTFDQALPDGQSAVVYPRGTPHNISFRTNSFTATFDPKTGLPTDYVTDLSVFQDGELVAHTSHLRVNDPLSYGGVVFHQSSLISSVAITITDKQGNILFNDAVVLDQTETTPSGLAIDYARGVSISGSDLTMSVLFLHDPSLQLAQVPHPSILIGIGLPGSAVNQDKVFLRLRPGESGQSVDKEWTVKLNSASEATVLLVTKDTGSVLIWPTAVILILSLCVSLYFPQRRIWVRIEGERVQMAALREHFTNMRTDLLGVKREVTS